VRGPICGHDRYTVTVQQITEAGHGPFETERQASQTAAVRAVYAAFDADPGPGKMAPRNRLVAISVGDDDSTTLTYMPEAAYLKWSARRKKKAGAVT